MDYRAAGVDIERAEDAMALIRRHVESTFTAGARDSFGAFGGMFRLPSGMRRPVLVSSADGVGSKIRVAIGADRHDTIGQDLVNHCVNDVLVQGALPLFFLDYVAFARLDPTVLERVVAGLAAACRENGCALIGGETAEMPDLYAAGDYDLAGFIVGAVEEDALLGPARAEAGDSLIALASSGLHTNGFTLARRIVSDRMRLEPDDQFPGTGESVADVFLRVHRSYLSPLRGSLRDIHSLAHITGGGIPGNLARALPDGLDAVVDTASWTPPDVFRVLGEAGEVETPEMFRTFNMGVGMIALTPRSSAGTVLERIRAAGCEAWIAGEVVPGTRTVLLQ